MVIASYMILHRAPSPPAGALGEMPERRVLHGDVLAALGETRAPRRGAAGRTRRRFHAPAVIGHDAPASRAPGRLLRVVCWGLRRAVQYSALPRACPRPGR